MNELIETVILNNFYIVDNRVTQVIREYLLDCEIEDFNYDPDDDYSKIIALIFEYLEDNDIKAL